MFGLLINMDFPRRAWVGILISELNCSLYTRVVNIVDCCCILTEFEGNVTFAFNHCLFRKSNLKCYFGIVLVDL